jgi:hypothetical protein
VVLKVLRPGIREIIRADLELMEWLARLTRGYFENQGFYADAVVAEFSRQLERETDLELEARNIERMAKDFESVPGVGFPRVYHDATRRSVLAHGRSRRHGAEQDPLRDPAGPDPDGARQARGQRGVQAVPRDRLLSCRPASGQYVHGGPPG